jgi:hypothetical protein
MDFIPNSLLEDVSILKSGKAKKTISKFNDERTSTMKSRVSNLRYSGVIPKPIESTSATYDGLAVRYTVAKKEKDDIRKVLRPNRPKTILNDIVASIPSEETSDFKPDKLPYEDAQLKVATTRKEVLLLRNSMRKMLDSIGSDKKYPTEMHAFVDIIREENVIYSQAFQEIIRQVTVNMVERGELLSEIRSRYAAMFTRIPEHVLNLHTELVAHRKLNRRLSEELMRAKEHVAELCKEIEYVREHDEIKNNQAREAQEKLLRLINDQDSNEESMEAFHKLYRMQRSRLEHQVGIAEKEKRLWINAATSMATRISEEYGIDDLLKLQRHEESRLRITNHMVVNISDANANDLHDIEQKIDEWRTKLTKISKSIVGEDFQNIELLSKVQRQMRKVLKNLITNEPQNKIELGHKLLTDFHIFDVQSLAEHLQFWTVELTEVAKRFTSGRDLEIKDEIATSRRMTTLWVELALRLLRRNQDSTNGDDYLPLTETLKTLQGNIFEWCNKLETRAMGEDGVTNVIMVIQSHIEDRLSGLTKKGINMPLSSEDRLDTIQNLNYLVEETGLLISMHIFNTDTLSNTAEREQHKIPLQVENWIGRVLEQMNNDMDSRSEDNIIVHTSVVSWMVNLLLPTRNVKESKEEQFETLEEQVISIYYSC